MYLLRPLVWDFLKGYRRHILVVLKEAERAADSSVPWSHSENISNTKHAILILHSTVLLTNATQYRLSLVQQVLKE